MDTGKITHSLNRIRSIQPIFGEVTDDVKLYIIDYLNYYDLHMVNAEYVSGYIKARGEQLFVQRFRPRQVRGTVLLLHGYLDHSGSLSKTIHFLVEGGYTVICFDLLGHGLSSGKRAAVKYFTEYIDSFTIIYKEMLKHERRPLHFIAHSTGAAIGLDFIENNQHSFEKVILISPLFRPYLWKVSKVALWFAKPYIKQLKRTFTRNSSDPAFLQFTYEDPLQEKVLPLDWLIALNDMIKKRKERKENERFTSFLMIQGDRDRTVQTKFGFTWARTHYPNSSFVMMKGGRHHLLNEEAVIRNQTYAVIKKYLESD